MVWTVISSLCLFINTFILFTCSFFRSSRRGILATHWVIINWLISTNWESYFYNYEVHASGVDLLLPMATFYVIVDHLAYPTTTEHLCQFSQCLFTFLLVGMDSFCFLLALKLHYEALLVILSFMIFAGVLLLTAPPIKLNINTMLQFSTKGMFSNHENAFDCLGRYGIYLYVFVVCQLMRNLVPALRFSIMFSYVTYVGLTICTLSFLTMPAYIGGLIQAIKLSVAYATNTTPRSPLIKIKASDC